MAIQLKTLNVLSATSQPRNAATSHLYAHELLRHLGCTRATWETYNVHIGSFFMHIFSATTHRKKKLAMPIHLKTLNVLSATSQPRNDATSHLYAHELLRHLGCSRASWETYNVHIGSFFMHIFSATTHRKKKLAMPIHLKTLNVLSATSQPRNAATSHLYAHELLRHLGCSRASWELFCLILVLPFLETCFYVCSHFHKKDH